MREDGPPNTREAHGVAKRMDEDNTEERAIPEVEERRVDAEEIGVGELDHGADNGVGDRDLGMGDAELVKVVDVGKAEDQGGQEDDALEAGASDEEERYGGGPK